MKTNPKLFEMANILANLTVLEAKELIDILENDYGIKPPESIVVVNETSIEEEVIEQTEFDVYLKEIGPQKLPIIKKVKEFLGLGLKDTKDLVESAPCVIKEKVTKIEAEELCTALQNLGATVEIK